MTKKKYYQLTEIFTPSQPANYTFVERTTINKRLKRALNTLGKQIIIYGYSGAGKTTLLTNKLKEEKIDSITTRCMSGMTLADIVKDAFNQLEVYYVSQKDLTKGGKLGGSLSASYFGVKASLSSELNENDKVSTKKAVELPITPQTLAKFIGESSKLWVLEDYHKVRAEDKVLLAQIMKVFMDSSVDYPKLKIVAIGAVNTAREVIQFDSEMKNRISEIEVPLMDNESLQEILTSGEKYLNITFPEIILNKIVAYSSGLPAVTHQLALLVCESNKIFSTNKDSRPTKIDVKSFDEALDEYLEENSDTFKSVFETATRIIHKRKNENPTDILNAILISNKENITFHEVKENFILNDKNYKGNNLKKYLDELTTTNRAEIIRFNKDSNTYYFSNPFIKAYCQCAIRNNVKTEFNPSKLLKEFRNTLNNELEIARKAFLRDFEE
ncbi:MAG TPA: hypothetical protein ENH87_19575 [Pricia antarctica]|uniref:AAA ATPase domain-containing protein n=2 Tax=root TaxID=1 RepID=A0A831QTH8_9FLAO|nr:hypothetical protein [Pricia antarctica]